MSENKEMESYVCTKCQDVDVELHNKNKCEELVDYKCNKWFAESAIHEDHSSILESETSDSLSVSETTEDTGSEISDLCQNRIVDLNGEVVDVLGNLKINQKSYRNINLTQCNNVHLGTVAKIYGPVQINQTIHNAVKNVVSPEVFLNGAAATRTANKLHIINRLNWLAQDPVGEIDRLDGPVKLVIISHTATQSALTQAENVHLVRLVQTFHIESKKWYDIGYNFLVGCDGIVYEGRGWGAVGAHTFGYNNVAIGISFVGCFMNVLPNEAALYQAKALIEHGVAIGEIDKDYVLVGHCQCCPTESPGMMLFNEIKTWDHWSSVVPT